jgi:hypothetical protein
LSFGRRIKSRGTHGIALFSLPTQAVLSVRLKQPETVPIEYLEATAELTQASRQQSSPKEKIMSAISLSSIVPQPLSTSPTVSADPKSTFWQKYLDERRPEVQQLKDALKSGDLSAAEQAYNNLVALGNNVLHKDNPFLRSDRALDFNAIGGALQNGDLAGAQQAFAALQSTFHRKLPLAVNPSSPISATAVNLSNTSNAGPEIALSSSNANGAKASSASGVNVIA